MIKSNKIYYIGASIIGFISLFFSFKTIFENLKNQDGISFALAVPIAVDILIIYLTFAVIKLTYIGKNNCAKFFKSISYFLIGCSLYLNTYKAFTSTHLNIAPILSHITIVFSWIICAEILVIFSKNNYQKQLIEERREEQISNMEYENKVKLLQLEHEKSTRNILKDSYEYPVEQHISLSTNEHIDTNLNESFIIKNRNSHSQKRNKIKQDMTLV